MTDTEKSWERGIGAYIGMRNAPLDTTVFMGCIDSSSVPAVFKCTDGNSYVVKSAARLKMLAAEQVVGTIAQQIGVMSAEIALVNVSKSEQIEANEYSKAKYGAVCFPNPGEIHLFHGSRLLRNVSHERAELGPVDLDHNRANFAMIAALYGWLDGADQQVVYRLTSPKHAFTFDYGKFLPGHDGTWTVELLNIAAQHAVEPDKIVLSQCGLNVPEDLRCCLDPLRQFRKSGVCEAAASPPGEWGISMDERVALAGYIDERRRSLISTIERWIANGAK